MKTETTLPPLTDPPKIRAVPDDLSCGVGAELRRVRQRRGITQGELAKAVGLERTSITNIERGRQKLSLVLFEALANALDMDVVISMKPKKG